MKTCEIVDISGLHAEKADRWLNFLEKNNFNFESLKKIDFSKEIVQVTDRFENKFSIDFLSDRKNYHKAKSTAGKELLGRALGAKKYGSRVLDLSVGLAIDAIFLCQLGFDVIGVERNPLIFLCLEDALAQYPIENFQIFFGDGFEFLGRDESKTVEIIYFDPMFPEKRKSALSRQEMVFFRHLVGADEDAGKVLEQAFEKKLAKRVVIKRPASAPVLNSKYKPSGKLEGKLVRFDIYSVQIN